MSNLHQQMEGLSLTRHVVQPGRVYQQQMDGCVSIYAFELKPGQKIYRYDIEIVNLSRTVEHKKEQQPANGNGMTNGFKSITSGASDDGQKGRYNKLCFDIVQALYNKTGGFGTNAQAKYVYDNRKNLFTNVQLRIDTPQYDLMANDMSEMCRRALREASVRIMIQPSQTSAHIMDLCDLQPSIATSPDVQADHSLRMFLEVLSSQPFLNAGTHDLVGPGRLFERKAVRILDDGIALHRGVAKGARIIENEGKPLAALVIDAKTCAFFEPVSADQTVQKMLQRNRGAPPDQRFWNRWLEMYKGVRVSLSYAPSRTIVIGSVANRACRDFTFTMDDGRNVDMTTYFRERKNINIQHPEWPAIKAEHDREAAYPLQCLIVLPNQRVPIEKMSDFISRELLNANTTVPEVRYQTIDEEIRRIGLLNPASASASFMLQFGVRLMQNQQSGQFNNVVKINVRQAPKIKFGDNTFNPHLGKFDERQYKYYCAGVKLNSWVIAHPRRVDRQKVEVFMNNIVRTAGQKGLQLPRPEYEYIEFDQIAQAMEELRKRKVQFLFYIDSKQIKSHSVLKLNEKRFIVLTQHVSYEVIYNERQNRPAGPATVANVVNKLNMKLSFQDGLNYMPIFEDIALKRFDLNTGKVLVIGIDTSSAPKATPYEKFNMRKHGIDADSADPMVVGVCANYVKNPHNFCGDYFFQQSKLNTIDPELLKSKIKWVLSRVKKNRPKSVPEMVFVIRDGVSEGQVPACIRNEFPALRNACLEFAPNYSPKFVFCIVDKKHNKRFFARGGDGKVQNPLPCSVVDKKVVRPDIHEFYMQSHQPIKGTSKMAQYVFPINEPGASNDELQAFINGLCYSWQIVNLAPALPVPVRQAHELAKRGRNNYLELKRSNHGAIPMTDGGLKVDFVELTKKIAYETAPLHETRFTA